MLIRENTQRQQRAAFTLMEMLVVVAIIVALAGIGGYFLLPQLLQAQEDVAKTQVTGTLTSACKTYYIKRSRFPETLDVLLVKDDFGPPLLESKDALIDPWGKRYQYDMNGPKNGGSKPDIWTVAPSGKEIGNWSVVTN